MRPIKRLVSIALGGLVGLMPIGAGAIDHPPVEAEKTMVVSSQIFASEAGRAILRAGGNAVDGAVATAFALAVVHPCCGNIGGGGFLLLRKADGREMVVDFRETAPAAATASLYLGADRKSRAKSSLDGYLAAGVPGSVRGLILALKTFGTLPPATVIAPAIRLARDGFILTRSDAEQLNGSRDRLAADPAAARIFIKPDRTPWQAGDRLIQRDLADSLERIATDGDPVFYEGDLARKIAAANKAGGGLITETDLRTYEAVIRTPVSCTYRGYRIAAPPPPSSGGLALCETLNILENFDLKSLGFGAADGVHLMAEALRRAYADRNSRLGDPAFVDNPTALFLSKDYAKRQAATIDPARVTPVPPPGPLQRERPETTHLSVVDAAGNAVALTTTLNGFFGAAVVVPGTGILLNNEMDDFTTVPGESNLSGLTQGELNRIEPGKRPLSSMTPMVVTRDGGLFMVLGSPGGGRIISILANVLVDVIDHGFDPQAAVNAPRIHVQTNPDALQIEKDGLSPDTKRLLQAKGHRLMEITPWGAAEAILVAPPVPLGRQAPIVGMDPAITSTLRPGWLYGAHDDRRPAGAALGD